MRRDRRLVRALQIAPLGLAVVTFAGAASAQIGATTQTDPAPAEGALRPPRLQQFVQADYPPAALAQNLEGSVVLQLAINAEGRVTEARVLQGVGSGLDEAAVAAALRFTFEPARRGETAIPSSIRYRYRFNLAAARAAAAPRHRAILRGVVHARGDERAVEGASVSISLSNGATMQQVTDASGGFRFEVEVLGTVDLRVRAEGFQDLRLSETLADRDDVNGTYRLDPREDPTRRAARPAEDPEAQGEATIRARRPAREVTRQTLEFQEILRMPGTGGDALRAVQNFPGVGRAINGLLIVRGSTPQDTQIFADGTSIPLVYHFGGLSSVISTELLDRIDFYPGNYSARFGRAQGGIVDVGLRSPRRQGFRFVGNINLIDASLFAEGAITRNLSFAVSFRRSYVDAILGSVLSGIQAVTITNLPVYWDYQAVLEYRPGTRDRIRLAVLGSDDQFALILNRPNDMAPRFPSSFSTGIGFHVGQLLWDHTFSDRLTSRAMFSMGRNVINFGAGEAFGLDLKFWQYNARYELQYQASRTARVNVGIDIVGGPAEIAFNGIRPPTEGQSFNPAQAVRVATSGSDVLYRPGAYAELELTPVPSLRLIPALRVDYARDTNRVWAVQPRFSFRWEFLRDWFIKGGVGVFDQPPQPQQSSSAPNVFQPSTTTGNPFLAQQRSIQYGFGIERNFSQYVTASVEGFYKDLDSQVVSQTAPNGPAYLNTGVGRIYGAEILLRHRPSSRFFGWLAYTISRSERRDAPGLPYRVFQFDQTHILTIIGSYQLGRGWEIGARFRLVSGNPITPVAGSVFNGDSGTYLQIPGQPFSARNDPFHQLDVRIDKTWRWSRGSLNLYLEVLNVYNNTNPEGVQYNFNFTQSQTVSGIPIFPNLGVRVEY
jgi:TonB family protein